MKLNLKIDQQLIRARIKVVCDKLLHLNATNLMVLLSSKSSHNKLSRPTALYTLNCSNNIFIIFHADVKIKNSSIKSTEFISPPNSLYTVECLCEGEKLIIIIMVKSKVKKLDRKKISKRLRGSFRKFLSLSARDLIEQSVWEISIDFLLFLLINNFHLLHI